MLSVILSWLGSLLGGPFAKAAVDAYKAKLDATNSHDARTAEIVGRELAVEQREVELATQLLIVEQGNWMTRWVRPLWALPFVIFTFKVVVYDKVLGLGSTPALDPAMWNVFMLVAGAYFGGRTLEKITTILKRK